MSTVTEEEIIDSQAFRAINLIIDQKTIELRAMMEGLRDRSSNLFREHQNKPHVSTRIYCEDRDRGPVELPAHVHEVKDLAYYLTEIARLDKDINELMQYKCRLTGDWDFTHGNMSDMIHVFGEKIES